MKQQGTTNVRVIIPGPDHLPEPDEITAYYKMNWWRIPDTWDHPGEFEDTVEDVTFEEPKPEWLTEQMIKDHTPTNYETRL